MSQRLTIFLFPLSSGEYMGFRKKRGRKIYPYQYFANRIFADQGEVLIDGIPAKENMGVHLK